MKNYFVYIITNRPRGTVYIGVTNDLERRIYEHKNKTFDGFSKKYNLANLVYFAEFGDVNEAIACEKKLKGWKRDRKIALIEEFNKEWRDLSKNWV